MEDLINELGEEFTVLERRTDVVGTSPVDGSSTIIPVIFQAHGFKKVKAEGEVESYRTGLGTTAKAALESLKVELTKVYVNNSKEEESSSEENQQ